MFVSPWGIIIGYSIFIDKSSGSWKLWKPFRWNKHPRKHSSFLQCLNFRFFRLRSIRRGIYFTWSFWKERFKNSCMCFVWSSDLGRWIGCAHQQTLEELHYGADLWVLQLLSFMHIWILQLLEWYWTVHSAVWRNYLKNWWSTLKYIYSLES